MEKQFIKGIDLCEDYYRDVVKDIIESEFPKLKYSAGLIDHGSEVLGYDNQISTDHDWGPRVMIFLDKDDIDLVKPKLLSSFDSKLPVHFKGYPVSFGKQGGDALKHRIDIYTPQSFFSDYLGFNISDKLEMKHWLLFPEQKLKTIRSGKLFCDGLNVENIRKKFFYYPKDVWLYLMACDWQKIGQEEPFVGRCGDVGDELGSSVIASRLVHIMMHLSFLMEQDYAPYSKWFGTAFLKLKCAKDLSPMFQQIFICNNWKDRERNLIKAYEYLAEMHNKLNITKALPTKVANFYTRTYKVINGSNFADELRNQIQDKELKKLEYIGSINQITYSVDVLEKNEVIKRIEKIFAPLE